MRELLSRRLPSGFGLFAAGWCRRQRSWSDDNRSPNAGRHGGAIERAGRPSTYLGEDYLYHQEAGEGTRDDGTIERGYRIRRTPNENPVAPEPTYGPPILDESLVALLDTEPDDFMVASAFFTAWWRGRPDVSGDRQAAAAAPALPLWH